MSRHTTGSASDDEPPESTAGDPRDSAPLDRLKPYARRGLRSGVVAGVAGGVLALRGLGALRRGKWGRGALQLFTGGLLLAVARAQWAGAPQRPESGQTTVTSFADSPSESAETSEADDAGRGIAVGPATADDDTATGAEPATATYERLGGAAFDEYSNEVPAPQQAFDLAFLSPHSEVYWGIHESDDIVVCTQSFDDLDDLAGVDYVASSQVDEERTVSVPDRIVDHWNELANTDVGVPGGTEIVFATTDTFRRHHCLAVVPEPWTERVEWAE